MKRSFLFLQSVASPFFAELGKALETTGYDVVRINFCGGDFLSGRFFSTPLKYINYRGKLNDLDTFYQTTFKQHHITDLVLFGDTRPIHASALKLAKKENINIHVYEEGYFRPNWVTLDNGGVNAYSSLSKDPKSYTSAYDEENAKVLKTGGGLAIRAWHDIRYHVASLLFKFHFSHYESHRPERALKEYWGWIKRMPCLFFYLNRQANKKIQTLLESNKIFYLLPLQLDADSQMRIHSPVKTVTQLIKLTIESFAKHAPIDSLLVIKVHPLDPWFINYSHLIKTTAMQNNVSKDRLIHIESGDLNTLLEHAKGTVLVNSTVGTSALSLSCPVIALGSAIYDMQGLTYQDGLNSFWINAETPDKRLFNNFRQTVINQTQINGSFYNQKGIEMAVQNSLSFFESETIVDNPELANNKIDNSIISKPDSLIRSVS